MKVVITRLLCLLLFFLLPAISNARDIGQGTNTLGGSTSYLSFGDTRYDDGETVRRFSIGAVFGHFISGNLELGSGLVYGYNAYDTDTGTRKSEFYTLAPYLTKHIPISSSANLTLTGQISLTRTEFENHTHHTDKTWLIGLGWENFISKQVAFDLSLNYEKSFDNEDRSQRRQSTFVNLGAKLYF